MISGLWSNTNFDEGQNTRSKALEEIEESYNRAILSIYNGVEEEIDWEDPFFAAIKRPPAEEEPEADETPSPDPRPQLEVDQA